jgi:hypothetical protein
MEVQLHQIFTSAVDGREISLMKVKVTPDTEGRRDLQPTRNLGAGRGWVVSNELRALYSWERRGTNRTGGWVGYALGRNGHGKSRPHRDSIPVPSGPQRVYIPTELSRVLV